MRSQLNTERRRYQRCRTANRSRLYLKYKEIIIKYNNTIEKTKKDKWDQFVVNCSRDNPWNIVYKISSNKINSQISYELKDSNNRLITESQEIANHMLNTLFPTDSTETDNSYHSEMRRLCQTSYEFNNDIPFTCDEVSDVVMAQNSKKSPGIDGLSADIIKHFNSINPNILKNIYNKCLEFSCFPLLEALYSEGYTKTR